MLPLWSRAKIFNRIVNSTIGINHSLRARHITVHNTLRGNTNIGPEVFFNRMVVPCAKDGFIRMDTEEKKKFDVEIKVKAIKIPKHYCNTYLKGMSKYVRNVCLICEMAMI